MLRALSPLAVLVVSLLSFAAVAADTSKALKEITDTAATLCGDIAQKGHTNRIEIQGDVKTELKGLVKRLADLGVTGQATIVDTEYVGVLQDQLADTMKDIRQCKLAVFNSLQQKLIPSAPPTRAPDGLYQGDLIVGEARGATSVSEADKTVAFQAVSSNGKADPARDIEFRDWLLRCPALPAPPPNTIVGQFSGLEVGFQCTILGKVGKP